MITKVLDEMALSRKLKPVSRVIDFNDYFEYCTRVNPSDIECIQQFVSNSGSNSTFVSDIYIPEFFNYSGVTEPVKMSIKRLNKLMNGLYTKMKNVSENHLSHINDFINSFVKLITKGINETDILYDNIVGFYSELKQINIENGFEFINNEMLKQTNDPRNRYICDFINGRIVPTNNPSYQWIRWVPLSAVLKDVAIIVNRINKPYGYVELESYKSNIKELMLVSHGGIIAQWSANTTISDSLSEYENYGFSVKEEKNDYSSVKLYNCEKKLNINSQSFSVVVHVRDYDTETYNSCMLLN